LCEDALILLGKIQNFSYHISNCYIKKYAAISLQDSGKIEQIIPLFDA